MRFAHRWVFIRVVLVLLVPASVAFGQAAEPSAIPSTNTIAASQSVSPKPGWDAPCLVVSDTVVGLIAGSVFGFVLAIVPAMLVAAFNYRRAAVVIAATGAVGGLAYAGLWGLIGSASCPKRVAATEVDAHVNTDSLYRLFLRFADAQEPQEERVLARAIHCEKFRIAVIDTWGEPALRLVGSRIGTPGEYDRLSERALRRYGSSDPGVLTAYPEDGDPVKCNRPTGMVSGRALDEETGQPIEDGNAVIAGAGLSAISAGGKFEIDRVPTTTSPSAADSVTLLVCAFGHEVARRRFLVRDGSAESADIVLRRLAPTIAGSREGLHASRDACDDAMRVPHR
jgi:hypothetical protein